MSRMVTLAMTGDKELEAPVFFMQFVSRAREYEMQAQVLCGTVTSNAMLDDGLQQYGVELLL